MADFQVRRLHYVGTDMATHYMRGAVDEMDDDFYEFDDKNMMVYGKRTKKSYRLGDRVVVSVTKVDRMMNTIDFMFEDDFETFED